MMSRFARSVSRVLSCARVSACRGAAAVALGTGLVAPVAVLGPAGVAIAQEGTVTKTDPYVVVVVQAGVPVRAGNSIIYYPVAHTRPGDVLVVDGESNGWLRVMYPSGVRALATPEEVQEAGTGKVRLTKPSRLKAPNANSGAKGAFLGVQESDLPVGTELSVAEAMKDDTGKVSVYMVDAPASARGYISRDAVRRGTDSESQPVLARLAPSVSAPPPGPGVPTSAPSAGPAAPSEAATPPAAQPNQTPLPAPATPNLPNQDQPGAQPVTAARQPGAQPPVPAPVTPPATAPSGPQAEPKANPIKTPPGMEIPSTVPVGDKDQPRPAVPSAGPATMDSLKELYNRVRAQPLERAELDQAIAEFERFKGTLSGSQRDQALARQMDAYMTVMKMRKEIRDAQSANATVNRDTELMKTDVGKKIVELEKQRVYTLIGRLVRSTVYDGGRTPELYRVMSPEPGSARTLGYLLPDPKFDYANKLEQVVGIIGELRPDESLRTNLIIPKRVDVVSLAPIVMSPEIPGAVVRPAGEMPRLPSTPPPAAAPATQPEKP